MKKTRLPLPVLVLILATLFLFSSAFGEWIGGSTSASRTSPIQTVEQQQAAILYVRVMSWVSHMINHPEAQSEDNAETAQPVELDRPSTDEATPCKVQLCALNKPSHPSTNTRKSLRGAL